jgi:transposase
MDILRLYVGLDYHSDSIRVCVLDEFGQMLLNRSVGNEVGMVVGVVRNLNGLVMGVALEACSGTANFATDLIQATGWTVKLAHAGSVQRLKKGQDKTDHGDAWHLADLLRVNYLPVVWLADDETRQLRRLARYRQALSAEIKKVRLRIRSLLKEERVVENCPCQSWTKTWLEWVRTSVKLGEHSQWILDRELLRLAEMVDDLKQVDEKLKAATAGDPVVEQLMTLPGVGLVTAFLLRSVIGRFERFRNGKHLSNYCSVSPRNASSGKRQADAGLISNGHEDLRAALIQLAKRLPRLDPRWKELHTKLRKTKGANVASAALANRWVRWLHHQMVSRPTAAPAEIAHAT